MGGSLPEMGKWDAVFDETYLRTYLPLLTEERTREEALGAVALAGLAPGADVLDCPVGFGRHAILLADAGYRVTGLERSEKQLAEAERRRGEREWPRLVRGDYRELPFADASFDAALNLFSSLGYLERADDVGVLREFRRVLRPGGTLVIDTAHRDALARSATAHTFNRLPDGSIFLHEHEVDWVEGTVSTLHTIVGPGGERIERRFVHRIYTAKEWVAMLREAGFEEIDAFGDWGESPPGPEAKRLIVRAR
jgi:ubiquinone/menaquinone biosynthesis C-methylase UbiE